MPARSHPHLRERILQFLQRPNYQPLDLTQLGKALRLPNAERRELRPTLVALEREGCLVRLRQDRYALPRAAALVPGKLQVHRNGAAHLLPETAGQPEVFVSAADLGTGMHGDQVLVRLKNVLRQPRAGTRLEGVVVRVVHRATDRLVGLLQQNARREFFLQPDDPRFQRLVTLRPGAARLSPPPQVGDKAVVQLDPWDDPRANPEGEIIEVLGPAHAPGVDMLSIVRKFELRTEFPADVQAEAERIPETVDPAEIARREDLRDRFIVTIDPDDARDFDDAIDVATLRSRQGEILGWRLGVHIADVSHYVRPGTALDREARGRGNSTYLVDRVLPMLPERLSNGICSLKPGVERLTFSAFMEFTRAGKMKSAWFGRSVIRSAARLSYRQAFAILQGNTSMPPLPPSLERETRGQATLAEGPPVPVQPQVAQAVKEAWELAAVLRRQRFEHGSLDLDFPEVKIWLDARGKPARLEKVENDISHQLIEEFMLAANEAVALELKNQRVPAVYRIHEDPDPERLQTFRELAVVHGIKVGDLTHRPEVRKVLGAIKGLREEYALKLQFLKSLKRAAYAPDPIGHYGLAKVNYTHFTSPIRRYADLLVHRSLARAAAATVHPESRRPAGPRRGMPAVASVAELGELAAHLSETERVSADAERDSVILKKIEYFQQQLASRRPDSFRAVVIDVKPFGLRVELPDLLMSGFIHVTSLPDDYYLFDAGRLCFTGRRTRRRFKLGDEMPVVVERVDPVKQQVDFAPAAA